MMIKFTNAHDDYRGNIIWINTDHIVAVYEHAKQKGGSLSTVIYGVTGIEWTVEESVNEVHRKILEYFPGMLVE